MYCKHCGKVIADDSKFCQHCGGNVDSPSRILSTEKEIDAKIKIPPPKRKTKIADAIIFVAKELRFWIPLMAVLWSIVLVLVFYLRFDGFIALTIFIYIPVVLIILWRYVSKIIKWCVKWVNTNKSK